MKHFWCLINCFTQKIFCIQNCTQIYRNITKYVTTLRSIFSVTQVLGVTSSLLYRNGWARPFKKGAITKNEVEDKPFDYCFCRPKYNLILRNRKLHHTASIRTQLFCERAHDVMQHRTRTVSSARSCESL